MEVSLLSCPVCLKPHFEGVDSLRSSLISVATTYISCPVCSELFLGLDKLTIHLFSHITNNQVVPGCSSLSQSDSQTASEEVCNNSLNDNLLEVVPDMEMIDENESNSEKSRIVCDICNFSFSDETILDLHQKLLHQTPPDRDTGRYKYHCHLCSKQFKMRGSLMVHLRVAHFEFIQSHKNDNSESTNTTDDLQQNPAEEDSFIDKTQQPSEEKKTEKRKILNGCAKESKVPDNNKQWECDVCLKLFTTKYFLKKHKRLHTGEMPYYCSECNKYFTFQQSYHKHMLYHSDDKPHICLECGRAFKELSTLHNHERIHSGERPFPCETCGKRFRQRVSYLVHRRIHTGAMPYKCTACNKSFRYKVSQRSHKCPINPPGRIVRTPDLVEKLMQNQKTNDAMNISERLFDVNHEEILREHDLQTNAENDSNLNVIPNYLTECEMLNKTQFELTENNGLITNRNHIVETLNTSPGENIEALTNFPANNERTKSNSTITFAPADNGNPDFFALILSPVLSDVQSLCLSNYTDTQNDPKKEVTTATRNEEALQTINEESFKELLYGSSSR